MKYKLLFFFFFLILTVHTALAVPAGFWNQPDYCSGGICKGDLYVDGNLTVRDDIINATYINMNITGDIFATGDITASGVICDSTGCISSAYDFADNFVNSSGDTMTGNLDMDENDIANVGYINISHRIYHDGEPDMYIDFGNDRFRFFVDGVEMIDVYGTTTHWVRIGLEENTLVQLADFTVIINASRDHVQVNGDVNASGVICDSNGCISAGGIWTNVSNTATFKGNINVSKDEWGIWSNASCIVIGNTSQKQWC